MNIYITGISGFLGSALATHLKARGHDVEGSTRRVMELGRPFHTSVFENQDAVIHCAHDFSRNALHANINGTKAWMETAAQLGAKQQIFLSSYTARPNASDEYARAKYEIERDFLDRGATVLRPGLVIGNGGLYQRQRATLMRTPIVPMLGDGSQPIASVTLPDFLTAAAVILEQNRTGAFNLFNEPMPTYRDFVRQIRAGKPTLFVPIPIGLALILTNAAASLRLPVPVKPAQIRALLQNQSAPWRSDLARLLAETNSA